MRERVREIEREREVMDFEKERESREERVEETDANDDDDATIKN